MSYPKQAHKAVEQIIADLDSRRGLGHIWEDIDQETKDQIFHHWKKIILSNFMPARTRKNMEP